MQFLFTLNQCEESIRSFWWRMTKPISLFVSFDNFQYLFKLIDIRDCTPNWQDYHFNISVKGHVFMGYFWKSFSIWTKRACNNHCTWMHTEKDRHFNVCRDFEFDISISGYHIALRKTNTYVFIIDRDKPFDGSPNL